MTVSFAERLKQFRTEKGLSQQQLAMKMLVDRSSIARWENGTRSPDITLMPRLAECLGVEVSALLNDGNGEHAIPRVILVDDEKPNLAGGLRVLCDTLPSAEITGFLRPSEALMFAKSNPVNLAVLDIELGRSNGFELCEKLIALHPETNVVFLTAWPEHSLEAWKTNACGFLVKPLMPDDVLNIIPTEDPAPAFAWRRCAGARCISRCGKAAGRWPRCASRTCTKERNKIALTSAVL